jgi:2-oxo-3-hexenedioate decarboxylase
LPAKSALRIARFASNIEPDTVPAFGLHGVLLIGSRHSIAALAEDWGRTLSTFEIDLKRDGTVVDHGRATNMLDGPVSALHYLVDFLARDHVNPPLAAGETWTTELTGVPTHRCPA